MPDENEIIDSYVEWAPNETENPDTYYYADVDPGLGAVGGVIFGPNLPSSPKWVRPPDGPPPVRPPSAPPWTEPPAAPPRVRRPKSPAPNYDGGGS